MVGAISVKWKRGASAGYWVIYVTLTFDFTHDIELGFFKVKFQNGYLKGIIIWCEMKRKTTPLTLTLKFQGKSLK